MASGFNFMGELMTFNICLVFIILSSFGTGFRLPRVSDIYDIDSQNIQLNGNSTSFKKGSMRSISQAHQHSDFEEFVERTQLTGDKASWKGSSLISVEQLDYSGIMLCLKIAGEMKKLVEKRGGDERMKGKVLGCMFYEPSTRTCASLQAAMARLGGTSIHLTEGSSSVQKGENLPDTIRCLSTFCDAIALRHPDQGSSFVAAQKSMTPVINAGDGPGEHPTQALLDLFTIKCELGTVEGQVITLVGDLRFGRTVHSLVSLMKHFPGVELHYVSPENLRMPQGVKQELSEAGIQQEEHLDYENILPRTDVLYMTRIQKERFCDAEEYERCKNIYVLTKEQLAQTKQNMIIMHPLPRVREISENVDEDPRAAYFRQMQYGMYMRMAILALIFGKC